jgi:chaperonin GroES
MPSLPLLPVGPRLLIQPFTPESVTRGGIHLPDSARTFTPKGTVLALSVDLEPRTGLSVGAIVYFAPYAGTEIPITNPATGVETLYLVLLADDIIAVVPPTEVPQPRITQ